LLNIANNVIGVKPGLLIKMFDGLPQQSRIIKDKDPSDLLKKAAKILKCNIDNFQQSPKILKENM